MGIGSVVGDIIGGAARIIDELHTSDEEREAAKAKLAAVNTEATLAAIELEKARLAADTALVEAQAKVVVSEQRGKGWLQRNWRGLVMLVMAGVVVGFLFGLGQHLTQEDKKAIFYLLNIGIGSGFVGSQLVRGVDKWANGPGRKSG